MIIGIGTDIIEIKRLEKMALSKFISRILTINERVNLPELSSRLLEKLAGRFAAKEAIAKALGTGIGKSCSFLDIEILSDENGKPVAKLLSTSKFGTKDYQIHLSIAHSEFYATAFAIIECHK